MSELDQTGEEPNGVTTEGAIREPAAPVVVIQYRTRGLPWFFVLPLFILLPLGAVLLYHRVAVRTRGYDVPPAAAASSSRDASRVILLPEEKPREAQPFELPLALNTQPIAPLPVPLPGGPDASLPGSLGFLGSASSEIPAPIQPSPATPTPAPVPALDPPAAAPAGPPAAAPVEAPAEAPATPAPAAPRPPLAIGFSVPAPKGETPGESPPPSDPAAERAAATQPPPAPTREQLAEDLRDEAAERRADMARMKSVKARAKDEIAAETRGRVEEDRKEFRSELKTILQAGAPDMGGQIDALCDRFGRQYSPELRARVLYFLSHSGARMSREARARLIRSLGVPEPAVLDFLANELDHSLNTRNGPRDRDNVRIQAAKQLLTIRLEDMPAPPPTPHWPTRSGQSASFPRDGGTGFRSARRTQ
ncbi:hypothetical protein [Aquisphaera insulae]|uniref:hypothetical protein n=1 Tax=Aquisphaera insulae TaxID=2712864 RepID=UPI0013EBA1E2|nr:hypothetical protein [Aquisphaera insulae]